MNLVVGKPPDRVTGPGNVQKPPRVYCGTDCGLSSETFGNAFNPSANDTDTLWSSNGIKPKAWRNWDLRVPNREVDESSGVGGIYIGTAHSRLGFVVTCHIEKLGQRQSDLGGRSRKNICPLWEKMRF